MKCAQCNASIIPQNAWQVAPNSFIAASFVLKLTSTISSLSHRRIEKQRSIGSISSGWSDFFLTLDSRAPVQARRFISVEPNIDRS